MKLLIVSILTFMLLFNCKSDSKNNTNVVISGDKDTTKEVQKDIITDESKQISNDVPPEEILSLEMILGGKDCNLKGDFMVAFPSWFRVNYENDIVVSDEAMIKVYDEYGNGKKIVGRPGQGPGEFEYFPKPYFGPSGYLTVIDGVGSLGIFNLFNPDYTFIKKIRIRYNTHFKELFDN